MRGDGHKGRRGHLVLILSLLLLSCSGMVRAQTVGELLTVSGKVMMQREKRPARPAAIFMGLRAGDRIMVGQKSSTILVLYLGGARYALQAGSVALVTSFKLQRQSGPPPRPLRAVSQALLGSSGSGSRLQGVQFTGVRVRGDNDPTLGPRDPWPMGGVRSAPVTLKWKGVVLGETGADGQVEDVHLVLRITEAPGGKLIKEWDDLPRTTHSFVVPDQLLHPGVMYEWSVTTVDSRGSGAECGTLFRILTPQERTRMEQAEAAAEAAREVNREDPTPDLLLGQIYERYGLIEEALDAYETAERSISQRDDLQMKIAKLRKQIGQ